MNEYVRQVNQLNLPITPRLKNLDIELTERCNNNCIHCCINLPMTDNNARLREMTTEQVKSILREAADLGCMEVRLTGGEPLVRHDFEELYLYCRHLGMKVLLFTNARLITPNLALLFSKYPPRIPIEITVYGMHQESYEKNSRVPGSFKSFWNGLKLLIEYDVPFILKSVLLPENQSELDEFEAWAQTLPWVVKPPQPIMFYDLRNRRDDNDKNRLINNLRIPPQKGVSILSRDETAYRKMMTEFAQKFLGPQGSALFTCGAGKTICVDAYGRIQPCMGIRDPKLTLSGDVGLAGALDQFTHLRDYQTTNPEYLRRCARCFLKSLCQQCPAKSWSETGTPDTPVEYLCDLTHSQARNMGWLGTDEYGWEVTNWQERIDKQITNSKYDLSISCI